MIPHTFIMLSTVVSPEIALIATIVTLLLVVVVVSIVSGIAITIVVLKAVIGENKKPL
jgi:hypothetical protein